MEMQGNEVDAGAYADLAKALHDLGAVDPETVEVEPNHIQVPRVGAVRLVLG
jgi:hypothetical protein